MYLFAHGLEVKGLHLATHFLGANDTYGGQNKRETLVWQDMGEEKYLPMLYGSLTSMNLV